MRRLPILTAVLVTFSAHAAPVDRPEPAASSGEGSEPATTPTDCEHGEAADGRCFPGPPERPWSDLDKSERKAWREEVDALMPDRDELKEMPRDERKAWRFARRDARPVIHSGIGIPVVAANSFDGLLLGAAAQYGFRPREMPFGYKFRVSANALVNLDLSHVNGVVDFEYNAAQSWVGKVRYRNQTNYPYAGAGGANAIWFSEDEVGNEVSQLMYNLGSLGQTPVPDLRWYATHSLSLVAVQPAEGSRLDEETPFGARGGLYFDFQGGVIYQQFDRWPRPIEGWQAEAGLRLAGSFIGDDAATAFSAAERNGFIGGLFFEGMRWQPLYREWLVLGARLMFDHTIGPRPFYDQNRLGGLLRDELGNGQHFTGYGIYRFGGDGAMNAMIELRGKAFHVQKPSFDLLVHISAYGEEGFVFDGWDLGPHLPTVGGAIDVIFQRMIYLRPYLSVGWTRDSEFGTRTAHPFFGLTSSGTL